MNWISFAIRAGIIAIGGTSQMAMPPEWRYLWGFIIAWIVLDRMFDPIFDQFDVINKNSKSVKQ